jgi:hypothetical protein
LRLQLKFEEARDGDATGGPHARVDDQREVAGRRAHEPIEAGDVVGVTVAEDPDLDVRW